MKLLLLESRVKALTAAPEKCSHRDLLSVESGPGWMWEDTQGYFLVEFWSQSSHSVCDMWPISSASIAVLALILIFFPMCLYLNGLIFNFFLIQASRTFIQNQDNC